MTMLRSRARGASCGVLLLLLAAAGCARPAPRSVLVVSIDTLRADRLGCYGNADGLTPHLDRLASRAVLFEDVTAPTPVTLPSHASLFTGRYPTATGVRNNGTFTVRGDEITLAEVLRDAGWSTAAVVAAFPLHRRFGLDQGFSRYDDALPGFGARPAGGLPVHFPERRADDVTERALEVWNGLGDGPRFLWVHYFDPHAPYDAPAPWAGRHASRYDDEVAYTDAEVGRLLAAVEASDPATVVVVVADHGEGLDEHDEKTHGVFVYQSTLRVPAILRAPGLLGEGRRVAGAISLVDLMPTLLALLGLESPAGIEGADLRPWLEGGPPPRRPVYAESYVPLLEYRFSELTALRRGALKYIDAPAPELYRLDADPGETRNLYDTDDAWKPLAAELAAFRERADAAASGLAAGVLDAEAEARLRALGYVAAGTLDAAGPEERRRDPKDMTDYFRSHDRALGAIADGRIEEGAAMLRALLPRAPENFMLRYQLAGALAAAGDPAGAEAELALVVAAAPEFAGGHLMLAESQAAQGRFDEATASFRAAAAAAAGDGEPHFALGRMLESAGRFAGAAEAYREALEHAPENAAYSRALAELHRSRGRPERARAELGELARRHPRSAPLWSALARAELWSGDPRAALEHLQRALDIDAHHADALLLVGEIQLDSGQPALAERAFRRVLESRPHNRDARFGLARALLAQDRALEGEAELGRVLAIDPEFSSAHTARGRYLERRGDRAGAAAAYRSALRINPADVNAREGLGRLAASAP